MSLSSIVAGVVSPGYGIASKGSSKTQELVSNVYPDKRKIIVDQTVFRQFPFFVEAGVKGIDTMHPGTINVDISPKVFDICVPDHRVTCEWIDGIRETFMFSEVVLLYRGNRYPAYVYFPCVSEQHTARSSMMEIIASRIEGVSYGDQVMLEFDNTKLMVTGI